MINHSPLFVVGYMHSGTTLFLNILSNHRELFSPRGESKIFDCMHMIRSSFPSLDEDVTRRLFVRFCCVVVEKGFSSAWEVSASGLLTASDDDDLVERALPGGSALADHGAIFRHVLDCAAEMHGRKRWVEKTPTHVFHIDRIMASIPDAQFIELVRDPRDVIASKKTRRQTVWTDRYKPEVRKLKHFEKGYDPLWDTLSWKSAIRSGQSGAARYPHSWIRVRYEDLVEDPAAEVKRVCDSIDLPFEPSMMRISWANPAEWRSQADYSRQITRASVARWRKVLKPTETALCQQVVGAEMRMLGYEREDLGRRAQVSIISLLIPSGIDLGRRVYRKWRLAGFSFLGNSLINYGSRLLRIVRPTSR